MRNSGESGDTELKCRRDHFSGLLQIRGTFGGRPPSPFRVTAGTKNIQRRVLDVGQMSAAFGERGRSGSGDSFWEGARSGGPSPPSPKPPKLNFPFYQAIIIIRSPISPLQIFSLWFLYYGTFAFPMQMVSGRVENSLVGTLCNFLFL